MRPLKLLACLSISVLLLCPFIAAATGESDLREWRNGATGECYTYRVIGQEALIVKWDMEGAEKTPEVIAVPGVLDGVTVTAIGPFAFENTYHRLHMGDDAPENRIILPEGITELKDNAFGCCHHTAEIQLPLSLEKIGENCFYHCHANISLFPAHARYTVENGFLMNAEKSRLIYAAPCAADDPIPDVKRIEAYALANYASGRERLAFPETVNYIGSFNAYDVTELRQITVPGNVKELADYAFYCNSATEIVLCEGIERIGARAFDGIQCQNLVVPASVKWFGFSEYWSEESADEQLIVLNPYCRFETEEEFVERVKRTPENPLFF